VLAARENDWLLQVPDPKLRALQVGDQRDRTADLRGDLAHEPGALRVLGVRAVRQVETHRVDAGADEIRQPVCIGGRRSERRHDLRSTLIDHASQST